MDNHEVVKIGEFERDSEAIEMVRPDFTWRYSWMRPSETWRANWHFEREEEVPCARKLTFSNDFGVFFCIIWQIRIVASKREKRREMEERTILLKNVSNQKTIRQMSCLKMF